MQGHAHQLFAIGMATLVTYIFHIALLNAFLIISFAGIMGIFSDWDLKMNIRHRGPTHGWQVIVIVATICTVIIFFLSGYVQIFMHDDSLTGFALIESIQHVPVPDILDIRTLQLVWIWLAMVTAGITHTFLDSMTYKGVDMFGEHYSGEIPSDDTNTNGAFIAIGWVLLLISITGDVLVHYFHLIESFWFTVIIIAVLVIVMVIYLLIRNSQKIYTKTPLICGRINGIPMCTTNGSPCISFKGRVVCFDPNEHKNIEV